jgi:hypothetical protein
MVWAAPDAGCACPITIGARVNEWFQNGGKRQLLPGKSCPSGAFAAPPSSCNTLI